MFLGDAWCLVVSNRNTHFQIIQAFFCLIIFFRCFTVQAKREADAKVRKFISELGNTYPDGRLMASHMFDAFYRMEYAPSRPTQLEACRAINASAVPLVPQV